MHRIHAIRTTAIAAILAIGLACADVSTAPSELRRANAPTLAEIEGIEQPVESEGSPVIMIAALRRTKPLQSPEWTCEILKPSTEGDLRLRNAGLKVEFPAGSVSEPQWVCAYAHRGEFVAYEFYPHGIVFNEPVKIQQDLRKTTAYHNPELMAQLEAGYMPGGARTNIDTEGVATFTEVFPIVFSDGGTNFSKSTPSVAKFYTTHFSGYALAAGRRTEN